MRNFATAILLSLVIVLSGCAPVNKIDVAKPESLREPIFVVTPPNGSDYEDDYAVKIENLLLDAGMRVATRPAYKQVRIELDALETDIAQESGAVASRSSLLQEEGAVVESFLAMDDTNASYRVNTYANKKIIEHIRFLPSHGLPC